MTRSHHLLHALLIALGSLFMSVDAMATGSSVPAQTRAVLEDPPVSGIGSLREEWEAMLGGPGIEASEDYFSYPQDSGGTFFAGFDGDLVYYIEWAWTAGESTPFDDMELFIVGYLPPDSERVTRFDETTAEPDSVSAPVTVHLYYSSEVASIFGDSRSASGFVAATYYGQPSAIPGKPDVTRVSLSVGTDS